MALKQSNYGDTELWRERPPSDRQYKYVCSMSNVLGVKMPAELTMVDFSKFIEFHKEAFNKKMNEIKQKEQYERMIESMKESELELQEMNGIPKDKRSV